MTTQLSRRHHFVPKFLLRPWLVEEPTGHYNLLGYWWNPRRSALDCKRRGLDSFCNQLDLLTLNGHALGKDAIEKIFLGSIDDLGSKARDALVDYGQSSLSYDQRCHFARLLLSLDARRPTNIRKLRAFAAHAAHELDTDPEVNDALHRNGIAISASEYVVNRLGWSLEDRGLGKIQDLVDNPEVGGKLINSFLVCPSYW